jgi:hypothetical protein
LSHRLFDAQQIAVWVNDGKLPHSPQFVFEGILLAFAAAGACLSGLLGGMVAAFLAARRPLAHAIGLILPIGIDTSVFLASGEGTDSLWFDLTGSATLMFSAVAGGTLLARLRSRAPIPPPPR